jgi:hypothetical protein
MKITETQIPEEVVEAAARSLCRQDGRIPDAVVGPDGLRGFLAWESYKTSARAALTAALTAWPGAYGNGPKKQWQHYTPAIILPLSKEGE